MLLPSTRRERFSVVETEAGRVKGFGGMPVDEQEPLMFTGIQILSRVSSNTSRAVFSLTRLQTFIRKR